MSFKENIGKVWEKLTSTPFVLLLVFLLAIFIGVAYYIYQNYVKPNSDYVTNREIVKEGESDKSANLIIIYADWCPHSKKVMNVGDKEDSGGWVKLMKDWEKSGNAKMINNYAVSLSEINESDKKRLEEFETTYKKQINGYPSIFLIKDDQIIEFDASPTEENLLKFLHDVI